MSTFRNKAYAVCESLLRVPPLLIVDEVLRLSFGVGGRLVRKSLLVSPTSYVGDKSPILNQTSLKNGTVGDTTNSDLSTTEVYFDYYEDDSSEDYHLSSSSSPNDLPTVFNSEFSHGDPHENVSARGSTFLPLHFLSLFFPSGSKDSGSSELRDYDGYMFHLNVSSSFSPSQPFLNEDLVTLSEVLFSLILFASALVVFTLVTENLIRLYSYVISLLCLYAAYMMGPIPSFLAFQTLPQFFLHMLFRLGLVAIFSLTRCRPPQSPDGVDLTSMFFPSHVFDTLLFSMFFVSGLVYMQPLVYGTCVFLLQHAMFMSLPRVFAVLSSSWANTKRIQNEYGLSHLLQVESGRLRLNTVFRLFWVTRAAYDAGLACCEQPIWALVKSVVVHGTQTLTGVIGLTATVSAICHQFGEFMLWLLYWEGNPEADTNRFGAISSVLFFILSLQTGLTNLDPEKRLDRLLKNIVLLATALCHALHQMVSPLLHAFRSFQAMQIRALSIAAVFFGISFISTVSLLRHAQLSTWSLAVLALAIEFKIKIIISLTISFVVYLSQAISCPEGLQKVVNVLRWCMPRKIVRLIDHLHDQLSHEDMIFYLKSLANMVEFVTGVFLFVNAVWIFLFESASAIRAIGMCIHGYFNIWCEAQKGWKVYCQRKTASQKIRSLADATDEQLLTRRDDVCSICYEEMESAKVTRCGHLFHAVCLRKWLYVQNTCPLCAELLYEEEALNAIPENDFYPGLHIRNAEQVENDNLENPEQLIMRAHQLARLDDDNLSDYSLGQNTDDDFELDSDSFSDSGRESDADRNNNTNDHDGNNNEMPVY